MQLSIGDFSRMTYLSVKACDTVDESHGERSMLNTLPDPISTYFKANNSGAFPGSPLLLDFAFTLSGPKITRLEIA